MLSIFSTRFPGRRKEIYGAIDAFYTATQSLFDSRELFHSPLISESEESKYVSKTIKLYKLYILGQKQLISKHLF